MFTPTMWKRGKWLQDKVKDRYPTDDLSLNHLVACTQLSGMEAESREKLLEELVDVFKFYIRLLVIHDITPEEFQKAFDIKSDIVEKRLLNGETYESSE